MLLQKNHFIMAKDKKIQVLLSSDDEQKLNKIITSASMFGGKLIATSTYVRDLILHHIAEYEGEQNSFVNEHVKKILDDYSSKTKTKNLLK
jgi:hypothetical protein